MMSKINSLLLEYGESHQNPTNKMVHWICVPAILVSLIGLIWSIPVPEVFKSIRIGDFSLNWAWLIITGAMIYYFSLSFRLAMGMMLVTALLLAIGYAISKTIQLPLWATSIIIFTIAWLGQFWGHKIEGKKPSFLKDIQFLLIGPVWLLSFIYRKLGIGF